MELTKDLCFNGEIVTPNDMEYEEDRQIWNRAIQRYPIAILYCTGVEDVISALRFCIIKKLKFRIRSGGHNYEGYSIGNNLIVIDVSRMNKIMINESKSTVRIQSGVENSELYEYLGTRGYPFPGGTCPTVGVAGYTLGGGWGLSCRLFGLGLDNVLEFQMVNYKGKIITANRDCNSDLFWALRGGGGGNFGIVTSLTFRLPPKLNRVTFFTIYYQNTTALEQANLMDVFQNLYETLDRRVNMRASFYNAEDEGVAAFFIGIFYGDIEELKEILEPLLVIPKAEAEFEYTTFLNAIKQVEAIYPDSQKFKSTGGFAYRIYSKCELLELALSIQRRPIGSVYAAVTFYGLGGAVKDKGKHETAFYYRDSNYIIGIQSVWENSAYAEDNRAWVASRLDYIKTITKGFFVNFPYSPLRNYEREYYGGNACRLQCIREKYDPFNVFNYPQSIK
ncbi:FAD-binding oxidoreductase [Clostridium hydrogeniformans]|uniref:FAD-binding oxidoreductase n=1 Tax=Clostridium hydrogeniformans TaxID=349933 RepID=UPI000489AD36|nr:FAD-binding oxidoreductase [Clostridium hydrogeniformans]